MSCEEFLAQHSDLLDGELDEARAVEMLLHMGGCERCARYDRVLRRGLTLLREAEPIQPKADPYVALQEHLARSQERAARRGPAMASLAAAALLGVFAWSALERMDTGITTGPANQAVQQVSPESLGFWVNPVLSGVDRIGPALPAPARWPHAITVGESAPAGIIPVIVQPPLLDRGPYTPLVLQPPDYGQAASPLFAPDGR